ncbi:MAG: T9SS type A sorting domain-containing protein [Bacteroidetes bacterium]|nr:T9SS type A sorting domain-containing protein [Bacteroidota bacterium]
MRSDAVTVMLRRVAIPALLTALFLPVHFSHTRAQATWPDSTKWVTVLANNGVVSDDGSDSGTGQGPLEVTSSAGIPASAQLYFQSSSPATLFLRMQVTTNPLSSNGNWSQGCWLVQFANFPTTTELGVVYLYVTGSTASVIVADYVRNVSKTVYSFSKNDGDLNLDKARTQATWLGTAWVEFQVPMAQLNSAVSTEPNLGIYSNTPIRPFFGTSNSGGGVARITSDAMLGAAPTTLASYSTINAATLGSIELGLLPVELASFHATLKAGNAHLQWQTTTETNNLGFEIQRAVNDGAWEARDFVSGAGSSAAPRQYLWVEDVAGITGRIRYRLLQIDRDGTEALHTVVELHAPTKGFGIQSVFPQPARDYLTVSYSRESGGPLSLTLHDYSGRVLQRVIDAAGAADHGSSVMQLQGLPSGTYFLHMEENHLVQTRRVVIAR